LHNITDLSSYSFKEYSGESPVLFCQRLETLMDSAEATYVHYIASTVYNRDANYPEGHLVRDAPVELLAERILADLQEGMHPEDWSTEAQPDSARAGVIKAGASYQRISMLEERRLIAAANASSEAGAPSLSRT